MTTYTSSSPRTPTSTAKANGMQLTSQVVTVSAALTTDDTIRFGPFPAGIRPSNVRIVNGVLDDDGAPALAANIGYSHADGSSGADADLFAAATTALQAASGVAGTVFAATAPVEIQKDWYLDVVPTVGAAGLATPATIFAIVIGEAIGAK